MRTAIEALGEVVALMGANGAGKSTIVKILSGVYASDGGSLELHGKPYAPASPQEAKALGIATMHQSIADTVVPTLSVADNLLLDRFNNAATPWFVRPSARLEEACSIAALVGLDVEQVTFMEAGVDLILHSQLGAERTVTVQRLASLNACPVRALKDWMEASDSRFGPIFRKVDRWGNVEHRRLGTDAIRRILARRARGHLRRGVAA